MKRINLKSKYLVVFTAKLLQEKLEDKMQLLILETRGEFPFLLVFFQLLELEAIQATQVKPVPFFSSDSL